MANEYPSLYHIVRQKNVRVADTLLAEPLSESIQFRRSLVGDKWCAWLHIVQRLMRVSLTSVPNVFKWNLNTTGVYTVKSLYADLMNGHTRYLSKYLWKLKDPLKIKIFYGSFIGR